MAHRLRRRCGPRTSWGSTRPAAPTRARVCEPRLPGECTERREPCHSATQPLPRRGRARAAMRRMVRRARARTAADRSRCSRPRCIGVGRPRAIPRVAVLRRRPKSFRRHRRSARARRECPEVSRRFRMFPEVSGGFRKTQGAATSSRGHPCSPSSPSPRPRPGPRPRPRRREEEGRWECGSRARRMALARASSGASSRRSERHRASQRAARRRSATVLIACCITPTMGKICCVMPQLL